MGQFLPGHWVNYNSAMTDTDKVFSYFGIGDYFLKTDEDKLKAMFERQRQELNQAIEADLTGTGFVKQMFSRELENHEFSYTGDLSDTLDCLGYTYEEVASNKALSKGLQLAMDEQLACDW